MTSNTMSTIERALAVEAGTQGTTVAPSSPPLGRTAVPLPGRAPLLSRPGWAAFFAALLAVCALAPVLNLLVPEGSALHLSDYTVAVLGRIMC
jgi:urea transport system permease protein